MKLQKKHLTYSGAGVVVVVIGWFALQSIISHHDKNTLSIIDAQVAAERSILLYVADLTRQNAADEATQKIVIDCNNGDRQRFDSLLDQLSKTISPTELNELSLLFNKCGDYYSQRKAIMSARLTLEVERYKVLRELRNAIQVENIDVAAEMSAWKNVAESESKWSAYFSELVTHQGTIITLLSNGKRQTSPEVMDVLGDVKSTREQMEILSINIRTYRETIAKL